MIEGLTANRLCSNCSQGFDIELSHGGPSKVVANHQDCPFCGTRNDIWVLITLESQPAEG